MGNYQGLLFDLDGVLVDTAKYHYLAWRDLAEEMEIPFTMEDNERLKGVSRMRSLEIILELGNRTLSEEEKEALCAKKNSAYLEYITKLSQEELLPGVREFLTDAKHKDYKIALGSASKNSMIILERLGIAELFDAIIDGTKVSRAKPDPEVFAKGAQELGIPCESCIVFEDAVAGIQAAHNAGMKAVGVGTRERLPEADYIIPGFAGLTAESLFGWR